MPCFHPIQAWRTDSGDVRLNKLPPAAKYDLQLPCGRCIACRTVRAREWSLRSSLECQQHSTMCWTTLTYEEKYKPPTLQKPHLTKFLKRLRQKAHRENHQAKLRFFACGEYGEQTRRPHYHAILWGLPETSTWPQQAWPYGFLSTHTLTPAAIAYVAGYVSKKIAYEQDKKGERVDPTTGEVYQYQPPFLQMSRRPGIGANAKQYSESWKQFAISKDGHKMAVPKYLHEAWLEKADWQDVEDLQETKKDLIEIKRRAGLLTPLHLMMKEAAAIAKQSLNAAKRDKL